MFRAAVLDQHAERVLLTGRDERVPWHRHAVIHRDHQQVQRQPHQDEREPGHTDVANPEREQHGERNEQEDEWKVDARHRHRKDLQEQPDEREDPPTDASGEDVVEVPAEAVAQRHRDEDRSKDDLHRTFERSLPCG